MSRRLGPRASTGPSRTSVQSLAEMPRARSSGAGRGASWPAAHGPTALRPAPIATSSVRARADSRRRCSAQDRMPRPLVDGRGSIGCVVASDAVRRRPLAEGRRGPAGGAGYLVAPAPHGHRGSREAGPSCRASRPCPPVNLSSATAARVRRGPCDPGNPRAHMPTRREDSHGRMDQPKRSVSTRRLTSPMRAQPGPRRAGHNPRSRRGSWPSSRPGRAMHARTAGTGLDLSESRCRAGPERWRHTGRAAARDRRALTGAARACRERTSR